MRDDETDPALEPAVAKAVPQPPVVIPPAALSPTALAGVIDAFVLREGTDYGEIEHAHATKARQVARQIEAGEVLILFDPNNESVTLVAKRDWRLGDAEVPPGT